MRISKIENSLYAPVFASILLILALQVYWAAFANLIPKSQFHEVTSFVGIVIGVLTIWRVIDAASFLQRMKFEQERAERLARTVEEQMALVVGMMVAARNPGAQVIIRGESGADDFGIVFVDMDDLVRQGGPHFDEAGVFETPQPTVPKPRKWVRTRLFFGSLLRLIAGVIQYVIDPWRWSGPARRLSFVLLIALLVVLLAAYGYAIYKLVMWLRGMIGNLVNDAVNFVLAFFDPAHPVDYVVVVFCLSALILCRFWSTRTIRRRIYQMRTATQVMF